jgi:hypothetical protein
MGRQNPSRNHHQKELVSPATIAELIMDEVTMTMPA